MKKQKLLIIGHKGYIGTTLTNFLKKKNGYIFEIYGIDSNLFSLNNYSKVKKIKKNINQDCRKINLHNLNFIPDAIIYLAAVSNDPMGKKYKTATQEINFKNCIKIAKQAKNLKIKKFIFASSCSMYGSTGNKLKKENDQLNPLTDYAVSKVRSEKYLKKLSSNKFKVFALRFATAAGMSNNLRLDLVFNDFVANSVLEKQIILLSNGQSWRPLIHVNDIAKSIFWALNYKLKRNFIAINIGSETWTFKIIDLAKKIAKIIPDTKIHINNADNFDKRSYRVNFNLFKKLAPKYQPTSNIKKSVIELAKFLKKEKKNLKNFRKIPKWSRLSRLNYLVKNNTIDKRLYLKND